MPQAPVPFRFHVPDSALEELRARLARTRFPDEPRGEAWSSGTSLAYLKDLVAYWAEKFDWRAQEARLNRFPHFTVSLGGIDLHFIHRPASRPDAIPLLLLHGWPGSLVEFLDLIPRLGDRFNIVAPSLPGFGLSFQPGQPRFGVSEMAELFAALMTEVLGYPRFGVQGGDWGAFIASRLGHAHPDKLIGIHLNYLPLRRDTRIAPASAEEADYAAQLERWAREESGYSAIQGTRPQTLAYGLTDSTGSRARSAPRSGPTMPAAKAAGRFPPAAPSMCRRATSSFPGKSCARRAPSPRRSIPTCAAGRSRRRVATSPRSSNPRCSRTRSASSSSA